MKGAFKLLTFCIGSTTVARLLERNLGRILLVAPLVESTRVSAFEEEHFNMVKSGYQGCVLVQPFFARQILKTCARLAENHHRSLIGPNHVMIRDLDGKIPKKAKCTFRVSYIFQWIEHIINHLTCYPQNTKSFTYRVGLIFCYLSSRVPSEIWTAKCIIATESTDSLGFTGPRFKVHFRHCGEFLPLNLHQASNSIPFSQPDRIWIHLR